jgi:hypothetical protein
MFPPGTRVRFYTTSGECFGTVEAVLDEAIDGDHVRRVRPDDGPVMLLMGRSLEGVDADAPIVVIG